MFRNSLVLAAVTLAGCAGGLSQMPGTPPVPALMVGHEDAGQTIVVEPRRKLTIQLPANHSEGYSWFLSPSQGPLVLQGDPFYTEERSVGGARGAEYWSFIGERAGTQQLRFEYRRPWERDKPAARTLDYTVSVR
ncbi:MAG TPA: protease inhibitor I42 family protein [Burkholderiales bacterium]|jgi:inhibitor of cysteine peptidase